ncbi:MAG: Uma2 family endonuclease [Nitrospirota bacterium]|nr:Uma2 family endonuclease [Nitrospirota bacterium]
MTQYTSSTKFTYEDYLLFPDDGKRHELIDGEHYVTPSPMTKHQRISRNLLGSLFVYIQQMRCGHLFSAPMDIVFSDLDVVQPDLLFISNTRASIITEKNIQGAPDLLVEILSDSTRKTDEIIKRKLYERYKVPEYWIIDPELETVKIYHLADQGYSRTAELSNESSDTLQTPLLPAWELALRKLFD